MHNDCGIFFTKKLYFIHVTNNIKTENCVSCTSNVGVVESSPLFDKAPPSSCNRNTYGEHTSNIVTCDIPNQHASNWRAQVGNQTKQHTMELYTSTRYQSTRTMIWYGYSYGLDCCGRKVVAVLWQAWVLLQYTRIVTISFPRTPTHFDVKMAPFWTQ